MNPQRRSHPHLSTEAIAELREHRVHGSAIELVEGFLDEIKSAAFREAGSYDESIGHGPLSLGWMTSLTARNCLARRIRAGEFDSGEIEAHGSELQLEFRAGLIRVHAYSANDGAAPYMDGSVRKERVLEESTRPLFDSSAFEIEPTHLVVAYTCDVLGLRSARVGVIGDRNTFAWSVDIYDRDEGDGFAIIVSGDDSPPSGSPSFAERQVAHPDLRLKGSQKTDAK